MIIGLYCIYDMSRYENLEKEDIPEEAWEWLKRFDLDSPIDSAEFALQLAHHYDSDEQSDICIRIKENGYFYDYFNGFKYLKIS